MAKIDLETIASGYQSTSNLNNNFQAIEDEFNDNVHYRDPPAGENNAMQTVIDMNSNRIINMADGVADSDAVTIRQLENCVDGAVVTSYTSFTPVWTADFDEFTIVNGFSVGAYTVFNGWCDCVMAYEMGSSDTIPSGSWRAELPLVIQSHSSSIPTDIGKLIFTTGSGTELGWCTTWAGGISTQLDMYRQTGNSRPTSTSPYTFFPKDTVYVQIRYRVGTTI